MISSPKPPKVLQYSNFELQIGQGSRRNYPITAHSPIGDLNGTLRFPFDHQKLENRLLSLENILLRAASSLRRAPSEDYRAVQAFGQSLFDAVFAGDFRGLYDQCLRDAMQRGEGLRVRICVRAPELASLPWEFLFDPRSGEYVCLSRNTPLVRDIGLPQPLSPLLMDPPLRILGVISNPTDATWVDVRREQKRIEHAIEGLQASNLVDLHWLPGNRWEDLQRAMWDGPWHIFHFIGHGDFDPINDEGGIILSNEHGHAHRLSASKLGLLLADHSSLRLVVLNSCEGARGGERDVFSSTASILLQRGIPAVLAMQYEITDDAASELSRSFYSAIAHGFPIDTAVTEARKAVNLAFENTIEWATPVLYTRSTSGLLFTLPTAPPETRMQPTAPPISSPPHAEEERSRSPGEAISATLGRLVHTGREHLRHDTVNLTAILALVVVAAHFLQVPVRDNLITTGIVLAAAVIAFVAGFGRMPWSRRYLRPRWYIGAGYAALSVALLLVSTPRLNLPISLVIDRTELRLVDMTTFRGGLNRTGEQPGPGPRIEPAATRLFQHEMKTSSSPSVVDGVVYVGSFDGNLYAIDAHSGEEVWHVATGGGIYSSPTVAGGVVYFGSKDHYLYMVDATTGQVHHRVLTQGVVDTSPLVAGGTVFFGSDDGIIYAIDALTGEARWNFDPDPESIISIKSSPALSGGVLYFGTFDGYVFAIQVDGEERGKQLWKSEKLGSQIAATPAVVGGTVYIGSYDGGLYALDAATGAVRWRFGTKNVIYSSPSVSGGAVYVGSFDGHIYAVDAVTGASRWDGGRQLGHQIWSSPAIVSGVIYVGIGTPEQDEGGLYALDTSTGQVLWQIDEIGSVTSSPAVAGDALFVGTVDGSLYRVE